jgi:hypothetical protein
MSFYLHHYQVSTLQFYNPEVESNAKPTKNMTMGSWPKIAKILDADWVPSNRAGLLQTLGFTNATRMKRASHRCMRTRFKSCLDMMWDKPFIKMMDHGQRRWWNSVNLYKATFFILTKDFLCLRMCMQAICSIINALS